MALVDVNAGKVEQKQKVTISLDKTWEQILALDKDKGIEVAFDYRSFKKLTTEQQKQLSMETLKAYWIAEEKNREYAEEAKDRVTLIENPLGMGNSTISYREYIRPRRGYHQYWANPGADFEAKMASGAYRQVREPTEEQTKKGYEPGAENGEVKKRLNGEGKVEAIALECTEDAYQQYLLWMDQQSSLRYGAIKTEYYSKTDDINRGISRRGARITPMDVTEEAR